MRQANEMDDLRKLLCRGQFSSLIIRWNDDCASNYSTVAQLLERDGGDYYIAEDFVGGEDEMRRCVELNSIWTAHWYPDTPVGFCLLHAADFATLLSGLRKAVE